MSATGKDISPSRFTSRIAMSQSHSRAISMASGRRMAVAAPDAQLRGCTRAKSQSLQQILHAAQVVRSDVVEEAVGGRRRRVLVDEPAP
jgi:hypothetical protein